MIIPAHIHIPPGLNKSPATPIPPSPQFPKPPITTIPQPPLRQLAYTARGVQFPGLNQQFNPVYLSCSSLEAINNGKISFSFWAQGLTTNNQRVVFVTETASFYGSDLGITGTFQAPLFQMNLGSGKSNFNSAVSLPFPNTDNNWHHYLGSFFTQAGTGNRVGVIYIDDELISPPQIISDTGISFNPVFARLPFNFGSDVEGHACQCGFSDVWIAPGVYLLDQDKNNNFVPSIRSDTRRIFTDRFGDGTIVPKDPGAWPGAAVIFTGPAATFGANFGFGGTFTLVGGSLSDILGP